MSDAEGHCKACRWWGELEPVDPIVVAMKGNYRTAQCTHRKLATENACIPIDGAMDGEAFGGIYTGPDFGCVHCEARDPDMAKAIWVGRDDILGHPGKTLDEVIAEREAADDDIECRCKACRWWREP